MFHLFKCFSKQAEPCKPETATTQVQSRTKNSTQQLEAIHESIRCSDQDILMRRNNKPQRKSRAVQDFLSKTHSGSDNDIKRGKRHWNDARSEQEYRNQGSSSTLDSYYQTIYPGNK